MQKYTGVSNMKFLSYHAKSTTWKRDYLLAVAVQLSSFSKACLPLGLISGMIYQGPKTPLVKITRYLTSADCDRTIPNIFQ